MDVSSQLRNLAYEVYCETKLGYSNEKWVGLEAKISRGKADEEYSERQI